jgi:hypothetical protein
MDGRYVLLKKLKQFSKEMEKCVFKCPNDSNHYINC